MQKDSEILHGHLMPAHGHMMIAIPPKHAVSQIVGYIEGKSARHLARVCRERRSFVSTVGRDEAAVRYAIRAREKEDARLEPMGRWR